MPPDAVLNRLPPDIRRDARRIMQAAVDALNPPGFAEGETCCKDGHEGSNITTAINAHVAHAHRRLADMARWIGRPAAEAARYDALADGIVRGLREMKVGGAASDIQCVPAAPAFVPASSPAFVPVPPPPPPTPSIRDMKAAILQAGLGVADLVEKSDVVERYRQALAAARPAAADRGACHAQAQSPPRGRAAVSPFAPVESSIARPLL